MKQRLFSYIGLFVLIFSSLLPALPVHATDIEASAGDLVKNESLSAVYYYGADGNRYAFPNESTFFSWYDNFDDVVTVSDEDLSDMPLVGIVTYKPGVRMLKIQSDPKVYVVSIGAVLHWVSTEEVAETLYGSDWNTFIDDVSVAFWPHYSFGSDITLESDYDAEEQEAAVDDIGEDLDARDEEIDDEVVEGAPVAPALTAPASTDSAVDFEITWTVADDALYYLLQTSSDSLFTDPGEEEFSNFPDLSDGTNTKNITDTTYFRIRGDNNIGQGSWSNTETVTITVEEDLGSGIVMIDSVPDEDQPATGALGAGTDNFCSPIAAANITEYWDNVANDPDADDVNVSLGAHIIADYIGFFMDTNAAGSDDRDFGAAQGTSLFNIGPGLIDFITWDGAINTQYGFDDPGIDLGTMGDYPFWDIEMTTFDDSSEAGAWTNYKTEIDAGRPALVSFSYWNLVDTGLSDDDVSYYTWGESVISTEEMSGEPDGVEEYWSQYEGDYAGYSTGHDVTGVGYINDYDAGDGVTRDWVVVHDNWSTTPEDVAIPWNNWLGTLTVEPQPNTVPEAPVLVDPGEYVQVIDSYVVDWDEVQGAKYFCIEYDTQEDFSTSTGLCSTDASAESTEEAGAIVVDGYVENYYYRAMACNDEGCSGYSNTVDMTVFSGAPLYASSYAGVQDALDNAGWGEIVYLEEGTYYEGEITIPDGVVLVGEGVDAVTIDASDNWIGIYPGNMSTIENITITNARSGLIWNEGTAVIIRNVLMIAENDSYNPSGVVNKYGGDVAIHNSTIYAPSTGGSGVVTDTASGNSTALYSSIINGFSEGFFVQGGTSDSAYNHIYNTDSGRAWYGSIVMGTGDVHGDPSFEDESGHDFSLADGSACIDTGDSDADQNDRDGSRNDKGAYGGPLAK